MESLLELNYRISSLTFAHPIESRFKKLFEEIKTKRKRKTKTMKVDPKNVALGLDKRTSIIVKNIPKEISSKKFNDIILNLCPDIDYFYVPINIKSRKKLRVAFINVKGCKNIISIYMGLLYKYKFTYDKSDVNMEICYSKYQGKERLTQRFLCDKPFLKNNFY